MTSLGIVGPIGGFANHIRWLTLLDSKFWLTWLNEEQYDIYRGVSWPSTAEYKMHGLSLASPLVINEIYNTLKNDFIDFTNIENKIRFIEQRVYPDTRTYHNWLTIEWAFRNRLNSQIYLDHEIEINKIPSMAKILLLEISPELSYKSYFKFNSCLNTLSYDEFCQHSVLTQNNNKSIAKELNAHYRTLNTDCIYCDSLDYDFYLQLSEFFDLDIEYDTANYVHRLWYLAQKRAESDFVVEAIRLYK